jgi:putative FmdB family regulatory protein
LEALQKISDDPLVECPECGEPRLRKKVSAAAFRLKGGGWYETDFKTSGQKNLAGGDAKAADGGSAPAESKSTAKDDGKADKPKSSSSNAPAAG